MIHHDYFGEITTTTGTLWQNYLMIDKMPVAVSLINDSKIMPTHEGLNRYAFACQHLVKFDKNNRMELVSVLKKHDSFMRDYIDDSQWFEEWKNYAYYGDDTYFDDSLLKFTQNSQALPLQDIVIQFEGNETDGFIQFNYKVYPHLPDELLWVQTDLTGTILNSVWENPYESLDYVGLLDR